MVYEKNVFTVHYAGNVRLTKNLALVDEFFTKIRGWKSCVKHNDFVLWNICYTYNIKLLLYYNFIMKCLAKLVYFILFFFTMNCIPSFIFFFVLISKAFTFVSQTTIYSCIDCHCLFFYYCRSKKAYVFKHSSNKKFNSFNLIHD